MPSKQANLQLLFIAMHGICPSSTDKAVPAAELILLLMFRGCSPIWPISYFDMIEGLYCKLC